MTSIDDRLAALSERIQKLEAANAELRNRVARAYPVHFIAPEGVTVGEGAKVHPTSRLFASDGRDIKVGAKTLIRRGAEIVGPVTIGSGCSFNRDAYIRANVTIGNNVNVGAFSKLVTDTHEIASSTRRAGEWSFPSISVGDGAFIGINVTVLGGVNIGEGAVIAAGSLVTKDVPPNMMVGGVPAKLIRYLDGHDQFKAQSREQ